VLKTAFTENVLVRFRKQKYPIPSTDGGGKRNGQSLDYKRKPRERDTRGFGGLLAQAALVNSDEEASAAATP
jgi:hypothetical protein